LAGSSAVQQCLLCCVTPSAVDSCLLSSSAVSGRFHVYSVAPSAVDSRLLLSSAVNSRFVSE
jgi:hypothetical protein